MFSFKHAIGSNDQLDCLSMSPIIPFFTCHITFFIRPRYTSTIICMHKVRDVNEQD